jgi:hypothetical protein
MRQFFEDMRERPPHHKLQPQDVTQPFSKTNCYWQKRNNELTSEQLDELNNMMRYITERTKSLDRWESGVYKRIRNYLNKGCPIMLRCFIMIKGIFDKISTVTKLPSSERSSTIDRPEPCIIRDDYSGGLPMYPPVNWEEKLRKFEEFEKKRRERESNGAPLDNRTIGTGISDYADLIEAANKENVENEDTKNEKIENEESDIKWSPSAEVGDATDIPPKSTPK